MSTQLLDLSKNGQIKADNDMAYAQLGYNFNLGAEFCHGINLSLEADVLASAGLSANLGEYVKAVLDVEAGIEGGLQVAAQMSPDATRDIGLIVAVRAYIKAYIRARLELGLSMAAIIDNVQNNVDSPLVVDVFKLFVEQIEIGVGVEANAQVGFTAIAELVCKGTLIAREGQEAGFDFKASAEAAFFYGSGTELFAKLRFTDLNGFYYNAINLVFDEVRDQAISNNPNQRKTIEVSMEVLKLVLGLVIVCASNTLVEKRSLSMQVLLDAIVSKLIAEFIEAYENALKGELDKLNQYLDDNLGIDEQQVDMLVQLSKDVIALIEAVQTAKDFAATLVVMSKIIKIMQTINYPGVEYITQLMTYCHLMIYLGSDEEDKADFAKPDAVILDEYKRVTNKTINQLDNNKVFEYLEKGDFVDFLLNNLGQTGEVTRAILKVIHDSGRTLGEALTLLFKDRSDDKKSKADNELLLFGFDVLETVLNDYIVPTVNTSVKAHVDKDTIGEEYFNIVFVDTLEGLPNVIIPALKVLLIDETKVKNPPEQPPRSDGQPPKKLTAQEKQAIIEQLINLYLIRFLAKNINFVTQVLLTHSVETSEANLNKMISSVSNPEFAYMAHDFIDSIEDKISELVPFGGRLEFDDDVQAALVQETRLFLREIFIVAKGAFGSATWTESRISQIGEGIEQLITEPAGSSFDFGAIDVNENAIERMEMLMTCSFINGEVFETLQSLIPVLAEIGLVQFKAFLLTIPLKSAQYILKILYLLLFKPIAEVIQAIYDAVVAIIDYIDARIEDIKAILKKAGEELARLANELVSAASDAMALAEQAIKDFFTSLKNNLDENFLEWLGDLAAEFLNSLPFFNFDIATAEEVILTMQSKALTRLSNVDLNTWVDSNSRVNVLNASQIRDHITNSVFNASLQTEIDKVTVKDGKTREQRWQTSRNVMQTQLQSLATISESLELNYSREKLYQPILNELKVSKAEHLENLALNTQLSNSDIKINSPLEIDASIDQLPMMGKYVYLEFDFDQLDVKKVLSTQIPIDLQKLVQQSQKPNVNFDTTGYVDWLKRSYKPSEQSTVQITALLNGKALPLDQFKIENNKLSTHLDSKWVKEGENQLVLSVIGASSLGNNTVNKYVQFYASKKYRRHPSNSVYINLQKSVFDAAGNDHKRARELDLDNKESVVISNATDKDIDIGDWTLEDAYGHKYTFVKRRLVRAHSDYRLYIGKVPGRKYNWVAEYQGRVIAILNNSGEFLKLCDQHGKVVSHVYTGSPSTNPHIHFLSEGGQ